MAVSTSATFGVTGQRALLKDLEKLAGIVKGNEVVEMLLDAARPIRDEAERRAPVGKTGKLQKSVFMSRGDPFRDPRGPSVLVSASSKKAPHYHLVELGTKFMAANPFMRSAANTKKRESGARVAAGTRKLIAKHS